MIIKRRFISGSEKEPSYQEKDKQMFDVHSGLRLGLNGIQYDELFIHFKFQIEKGLSSSLQFLVTCDAIILQINGN